MQTDTYSVQSSFSSQPIQLLFCQYRTYARTIWKRPTVMHIVFSFFLFLFVIRPFNTSYEHVLFSRQLDRGEQIHVFLLLDFLFLVFLGHSLFNMLQWIIMSNFYKWIKLHWYTVWGDAFSSVQKKKEFFIHVIYLISVWRTWI